MELEGTLRHFRVLQGIWGYYRVFKGKLNKEGWREGERNEGRKEGTEGMKEGGNEGSIEMN